MRVLAALLLSGLGLAWLLSSACSLGIAPPQPVLDPPVPAELQGFELELRDSGVIPEGVSMWWQLRGDRLELAIVSLTSDQSAIVQAEARRLANRRSAPPFALRVGEPIERDSDLPGPRVRHRTIWIREPDRETEPLSSPARRSRGGE